MRRIIDTARIAGPFAALLVLVVPVVHAAEREVPITEAVHTKDAFELQLISALRDFVPHVVRAKGTPGLNLALGTKGRLIWEAGFGYADVATKARMRPDTVYHSGSLGKTYTATAIMHLVDRGAIALEDDINEHLPFEVHNPLGDRPITVLDLLTHRSGLSGGGARGVWTKPESLQEALQASYDSDKSPVAGGITPFWVAPVGARFNYSNPGIATLGLIVQEANPDGLSFSDYVQKYVMDALGMELSQYPPAQHKDYVRPDIWQKMSTGYARMGGALVPTLPLYFSHYPAGGVLAKPADHLRLLMAMNAGGTYNGVQILKPETVEAMLTPRYEEDPFPGANLGLVWLLRRPGERTFSVSHAGGHMFGWRTDGYAWPELDAAVMIASNQWNLPDDALDISAIVPFIESWLQYATPVIPEEPASDEWSWKVSYVRGVLYAAMFKTYVGIEPPMPRAEIDRAVEATRTLDGVRDDWSEEGFRAGLDDVRRAGFDYPSVSGFWASESSRVTPQEARQALEEMGGRFPGTATVLFPAVAGATPPQ